MVPATSPPVSPERRHEIVDALRRGTVPQRGLDVFVAKKIFRFEFLCEIVADDIGIVEVDHLRRLHRFHVILRTRLKALTLMR